MKYNYINTNTLLVAALILSRVTSYFHHGSLVFT